MLGNGRLEALCFDGEKRLAHIRGKLRKKVWINQGDIILLSLRDYQDEKGDVILKYSADEARSLKAYGELPETAKINETDTYVAPLNILGISEYLKADLCNADMDTRVWMTMLSSTRIGTIAVMTRILMWMTSEGFACWRPNNYSDERHHGSLEALWHMAVSTDPRRHQFEPECVYGERNCMKA